VLLDLVVKRIEKIKNIYAFILIAYALKEIRNDRNQTLMNLILQNIDSKLIYFIRRHLEIFYDNLNSVQDSKDIHL